MTDWPGFYWWGSLPSSRPGIVLPLAGSSISAACADGLARPSPLSRYHHGIDLRVATTSRDTSRRLAGCFRPHCVERDSAGLDHLPNGW